MKNKENDMLDLNKLFLGFYDEISLTKTYKEKITKGRDALRNKIGDKFEEKGRKNLNIVHKDLML